MTNSEALRELKSIRTMLADDLKPEFKNAKFIPERRAFVSDKGNVLCLMPHEAGNGACFMTASEYATYDNALNTVPTGTQFYGVSFVRSYGVDKVPAVVPTWVAATIPEPIKYMNFIGYNDKAGAYRELATYTGKDCKRHNIEATFYVYERGAWVAHELTPVSDPNGNFCKD